MIVKLYDNSKWEERELLNKIILWEKEMEYELVGFHDGTLTSEELRKMLKKVPFFADFSEPEIQALLYRFKDEVFESNCLIIMQGVSYQNFYLILEGKVEVTRENDSANAQKMTKRIKNTTERLAILSKGDFFGENSLLNNKPANATVITLTETKLLSLNKLDFQIFAERFEHIQNKIIAAQEFVRVLEEMEIFKELTPQRVREISVRMQPANFSKGDLILHEGDILDAFYVVKIGKIAAYRYFGQSSEELVKDYKRGDYFGGAALLNQEAIQHTFIAETDVELLKLGKSDFDNLLSEYMLTSA